MDCSTSGLPVHHQLLEFTHTHVHWVGDAIQPCHPLSSLSPPTFNLSQYQGLFKWVSSSHQVAKVLELQHQSFQYGQKLLSSFYTYQCIHVRIKQNLESIKNKKVGFIHSQEHQASLILVFSVGYILLIEIIYYKHIFIVNISKR